MYDKAEQSLQDQRVSLHSRLIGLKAALLNELPGSNRSEMLHDN